MNARSLSGLVVATAVGAPMRSVRPKPIHLLCGRAMASYVLDTLGAAGVRQAVVVTGDDGGRVAKRLLEDAPSFPVRFVEQQANLGGADAALLGVSSFDDFEDDEDLLVVSADVPLIRPSTLRDLLERHRESGAACTLLTARADDPALSTMVGSEIVDGGNPFKAVTVDKRDRVSGVEQFRTAPEVTAEDSETSEPRTPELALGVLCIRRGLLAPSLRRCVENDLDGSVGIDEIVAVLAESGHQCETALIDHPGDLLPVDDRRQLADVEAELRRRTNRHWLSMGVSMIDPERTYIDVTVRLGTDVTIFPGTILQGATVIGSGCELGPDTRLDRCHVGTDCRIEKTTASLSTIGDECEVGPFAFLAPGSELPSGTKTGPFFAASGETEPIG